MNGGGGGVLHRLHVCLSSLSHPLCYERRGGGGVGYYTDYTSVCLHLAILCAMNGEVGVGWGITPITRLSVFMEPPFVLWMGGWGGVLHRLHVCLSSLSHPLCYEQRGGGGVGYYTDYTSVFIEPSFVLWMGWGGGYYTDYTSVCLHLAILCAMNGGGGGYYTDYTSVFIRPSFVLWMGGGGGGAITPITRTSPTSYIHSLMATFRLCNCSSRWTGLSYTGRFCCPTTLSPHVLFRWPWDAVGPELCLVLICSWSWAFWPWAAVGHELYLVISCWS